MGKKKDYKEFMKMFRGGAFPMPPMPFAPVSGNKNGTDEDGKAEINTQKENVKSTVKSALKQKNDRKKATADNRKEQWKQFFDYMMERQDMFAALIPDDPSSLPPFVQMLPVSPKALIEHLKEFEIMANEHFVAQADSAMDFYFKGREKIFDMVSEAMDKKEEPEQADSAEEKAVKKPGTRTRKTAGTRSGRKAKSVKEAEAETVEYES